MLLMAVMKRKKTAGFAISHLNENERGAVAIEYALIAGLIALVIVASVGLVGTNLELLFEEKIVPAVEQAANAGKPSNPSTD
ncbi:Flp family type IVb pilin [Polycladidibacter hongkongensis]|uniref:Flp family type IVb pilin n=1 Tax=Polycladidibacter hongkongensis TaxID=1647556 RepID=UPI0009E81D10